MIGNVISDARGAHSRSFDWRGLAKLAAAVLTVQLFFWFVFNPIFVQPQSSPVEFIAIEEFSYAKVATPDAQHLSEASFRTIEAGEQMLFDVGYHVDRSVFTLKRIPPEGLALLDTSGGDNTVFFLNGQHLSSRGDHILPDITYDGLRKTIIQVPPSALRVGSNSLDNILVIGIPRRGGHQAPLLGDYELVSSAFGWKAFLLDQGKVISTSLGFTLSLMLFVALVRAERKQVLLWLFLLTFTWSLNSLFFVWLSIPLHGFTRALYYSITALFLAACWPIFVDQWTGKPVRYLREALLTVFAVVALVFCYWLLAEQEPGSFSKVEDLLDPVGLFFIAVTLARLVWHFLRVPDDRYWEAAILIMLGLLLALFLFNTMVWGRHVPYLTISQPLFLLAFTVAFFSRNFRLFRSAEQINALLQTQLDERTAELEQAHARETALVRVEAYGQERQRIMRDMHDGLGSHLMSMLMMAKRGKAQHEDYAEGLQQVIDEMRLMIDSMDSVGESLSSALAIFRKRVVSRARAAGFDCSWEQNSDASFPEYGPRTVLQIFRILQEAYTNALKHSDGDRIAISIKASDDPKFALLMTVADNGIGMSQRRGRGRGLQNMQVRAASIGGQLAIENTDRGTFVRLHIPQGDKADAPSNDTDNK